MKLLAIDTGTEMLSIAVSVTHAGTTRTWTHCGAAGATASTTLIPAVMELLGQAGVGLAELQAICFGAGPGSFTGLRTACAVAQGLGFGARVPLLPVDSLMAVAEEARQMAAPAQSLWWVTCVLDARMDEVYVGTYRYDTTGWHIHAAPELLAPEAVCRPHDLPSEEPDQWALAGNAFTVYGERVARHDPAAAAVPRVAALPTATAMLRLAPSLLARGAAVAAAQALPIYVRDKVAKTTVERAQEKMAALKDATS